MNLQQNLFSIQLKKQNFQRFDFLCDILTLMFYIWWFYQPIIFSWLLNKQRPFFYMDFDSKLNFLINRSLNLTFYCLLGSQYFYFHVLKHQNKISYSRTIMAQQAQQPQQSHWELQLVLRERKPIKPIKALTSKQWEGDKTNFYFSWNHTQRVKQGLFPKLSNTLTMFLAQHTRIDNQSSKGPQDGFYNMALQSNEHTYTAANLFVPDQLVNLLTKLGNDRSKSAADKKAYDTAISRWDARLFEWVSKIQLDPSFADVYEMRMVPPQEQPRPKL